MKKKSPLYGIKKQVLKAPAYTLRSYDAEVKLNQNENPYDFPEDLKEETFRRYRKLKWSRYPDFVPDSLRARLADSAGWHKEGVLVGNGSNELLQATLMVLLRERIPVAIPSPTFTVYGLISQILGARIINIPLNPDLSYNIDELISKSEGARARALIISTPNNPTGSLLEEAGLRQILERFSGYIILDEAYYEFCGHTGLHFLKSYPRLIIVRTFSKAMGMAGLRLGYLFAHSDLAAQINKAKLPYNVNQFTLTAAQVALDHSDRFKPAIDAILKEKDRLGKELGEIPGVEVYPSAANFFLIKVSLPPRALFEELYQQGILIRDVSSYPMLSKCLRITVGMQEENDRLLTALRTSLAKEVTAGSQSA